ncbi:MAG: ribonuclease III [Patescibacteria group bacterium]
MNLEKIEKKLGVKFTNKEILKQAFTHKSALNEDKSIKSSNETLEFLGDAVLEHIVSKYLFNTYPELNEGDLTNLRTQLVRQDSLAQVSRNLNIGEHLLMSQGEIKNKGFEKDSILEDLYESIVGAIYLDLGFHEVENFVLRTLIKFRSKISVQKDPKGELQEWTQEKFGITPTYQTREVEKNGNEYVFFSEVFLQDRKIGEGKGGKKLLAEESSARNAIEFLKIEKRF